MDESIPSSVTLDVPPRIELRVPGPSKAPEELVAALAKHSPKYRIEGEDQFIHLPTGRKFNLGVTDHDDEIADVFAGSQRLSKVQLAEIAAHKVKVHLTGPGGSIETARAIMRAATALVRAGGLGVMIDSSAACHGRDDWLTLAKDKQPGGLYWGYVTVCGDDEELWSCGMHCLGLRDVEMFAPPDREWGGFFLHNFLGYVYQSGNLVLDGEALGDDEAAMYRVRIVPCTRFASDTPFHNPYGIMRLEKIDEEGECPSNPKAFSTRER